MTYRRRISADLAALLAVALVGVTSCTTAEYDAEEPISSTSDANANRGSSTLSVPGTTPAPPATYLEQSAIEISGPLADFDSTSSLTDIDGFTFDIRAENNFVSAEIDPTQDRPGFTSILLDYDTTLTVTNTLKDRVLDLSSGISTPAIASIMAVWPLDRPICQAYIAGVYGQTVPSSIEKIKLCAVQLDFYELHHKIPGGSSRVLDPAHATNLEAPGVRSIPERSVDEVLGDLNSPAGIIVEYQPYGKSPLFPEDLVCVDRDVPGLFPVTSTVWLSYPEQQCQPATRVFVQQPKP